MYLGHDPNNLSGDMRLQSKLLEPTQGSIKNHNSDYSLIKDENSVIAKNILWEVERKINNTIIDNVWLRSTYSGWTCEQSDHQVHHIQSCRATLPD